ncbi:EpsG family protein [Thioclava sp.]|uniref:EpsG family protein n=1 Tax=Thioclava sp. TaxID=1933450 RepID=UPI003AA9C349
MTAYLFLLSTTAWASILSPGNVVRKVLFFVPTLLIVGFKYEIGFDWHVYARQFQHFSEIPPGEFFENFFIYVGIYQHEPLYVLFSYMGAHILGIYEVFYCALFLLFVYSTARLGKLIDTNTVAAFFVIHLFLLFTLEFSTLRQMVSLSILNLGISFTLEGRKIRGFAFLILSPFFQGSSAIFAIIFLLVGSTRRLMRVLLAFALIVAIAINAIGFTALASLLSGIVPGFLATKLTYYTEVRQFDFNMLETLFAISVYLVLGYFLFVNQKNQNSIVRDLSTFLLVLIAIAIAGFAITTMRNRMLYEIITVAALLLFSPHTKNPIFIRTTVIILGFIFFAASLTKATSFMYVPYQNYLWFQIWELKSDGPDRQDRLNSILRSRAAF